MMWFSKMPEMVDERDALPGRPTPIVVPGEHASLGTPLAPPFPDGFEVAFVAMGCFWGAERTFYTAPGVFTTAVGYQGGFTPNATYEEVCSGRTGHTEAVMVVFDPTVLSYEGLLKLFYEHHDPTQGFRQGNDVGTQYRSAIYTTSPAQAVVADAVTSAFSAELHEAGFGEITTEVAPAKAFYYAEDYHQQYLVKNPNGYCGLGGTGVSCPVGILGRSGTPEG
jgi:peptide-methionine (S)-S-oxide reductase